MGITFSEKEEHLFYHPQKPQLQGFGQNINKINSEIRFLNILSKWQQSARMEAAMLH